MIEYGIVFESRRGDLMIVLHVFSNTSSSFTKMTENLSGLLVERETSLLSLALSDTSCSMRWYGTFSELIRIHLPHIIVFNPRQLDRRSKENQKFFFLFENHHQLLKENYPREKMQPIITFKRKYRKKKKVYH